MDDLDTLAAGAAVADDGPPRISSAGPHSGRDDCANCGAALQGPYCAACG